MPETYRIRSAIRIPLAIALLSIFILLFPVWLVSEIPGERVVMTSLFFFVIYLFVEVLFRRVKLGKEGVDIRKVLKKRFLRWDEVTHLGSMVMGSKAYILLTTTKGFYIISNNYERFIELLNELSDNLNDERVDKEVFDLIAHPLKNNKPVRSAWLLVFFIIAAAFVHFFIR